MARIYYLPADDEGKVALLEQLAAVLPHYVAVLDIHPGDLAQLQKDALAARYYLNACESGRAFTRQLTSFKNLLMDGEDAALGEPALPHLPEPRPAETRAGIVRRLTRLIARLKAARAYSPHIGHALGLIGSARVRSTTQWRPLFTSTVQAGHPVLQWSKGQADALEIWAERGDGKGFGFFTVCSEAPCVDLTPLPGSAAQWHYKAIYRVADQQVGQWSNVHTVTVGNPLAA